MAHDSLIPFLCSHEIATHTESRKGTRIMHRGRRIIRFFKGISLPAAGHRPCGNGPVLPEQVDAPPKKSTGSGDKKEELPETPRTFYPQNG